MTEQVWRWLVAHMPLGHDFTGADVKVDAAPNVISAALSALRIHYEVIKVVSKRRFSYVYQLTTIKDLSFGSAKHIHSKRPRVHPGKQVHRLKMSDIPGVITTVTDKKNDIQHTTHHKPHTDRFSVTGRISSGQPEMQDLRPHSQQTPRRHLPQTDFSGIEERVALNHHVQMEEANRLLDEFTRTAQLASFTDDELFAELKRRLNRGN